jgi:hypothetical protein
LHLDALGGKAIYPGDHGEQIRAETGAGLPGRAPIGGGG